MCVCVNFLTMQVMIDFSIIYFMNQWVMQWLHCIDAHKYRGQIKTTMINWERKREKLLFVFNTIWNVRYGTVNRMAIAVKMRNRVGSVQECILPRDIKVASCCRYHKSDDGIVHYRLCGYVCVWFGHLIRLALVHIWW